MSLARRIPAYLGAAFAGAMLLIAGLVKALDPAGFATQIAADVPFLAHLAGPLSVIGILVETLLGTALVLGFRRRWVLAAGVALTILFITITAPKLGMEEPTDCGCFGNFVVRTPAEVLVEDSIMLLGLIIGFAGGPGSRLRPWRAALLGLAATVGLGLPLASPSLPLDDFATRLKPGAGLKDLQLLEAVPEMEFGDHIVIVGDSSLDACQDLPESLYRLAEARPEARFWLLRPSEVMSRQGGTWLCLMGTEMIEIPEAVARPLYRTLPRSFEVVDGSVTRTWTGLPAAPDEAEPTP